MKNHLKTYGNLAIILPLIWLNGCAGTSPALRGDYNGYSAVYGDTSNQQLLLNLARLANDDPVYYLQLGSISSQYQFNSSAGFSPGSMRTDPISAGAGMAQHVLTLGGSLSAGVTAQPIYQYLPLTGSNFVQALLTPMSDKVYLTLYDQGYPADWVVRTMVASIEKLEIVTNGPPTVVSMTTTNYLMVTNSTGKWVPMPTNTVTPALVYPTTTNHEFMVNDPHDRSYPDFLAFCASLRDAQLCHMLAVAQSSTVTTNVVYDTKKPKLADVVGAIQANLAVSATSDSNALVVVSQTVQTPQFVLNTLPPLTSYSQYEDLLGYQSNRLTSSTAPLAMKYTAALQVAQDITAQKITLKTRTFEAAMFTAAKQEKYFADMQRFQSDTNWHHSPYIWFANDDYGPYAIVTRTNSGPITTNATCRLKVRPSLMLTYDGYKYHPPQDTILAEVAYPSRGGKKYLIADVKDKNFEGSQNQTVFTLLSYLFAQTAINTQNLPVQQLIQLQ